MSCESLVLDWRYDSELVCKKCLTVETRIIEASKYNIKYKCALKRYLINKGKRKRKLHKKLHEAGFQ